MPIESRYRHSLTVKKMAVTLDVEGNPVRDAYGQPVTTETTLATVPGLIQPRNAREVAAANQAGAEIGDLVCYMAPLAGVDKGCWILKGGARYDILTDPDAAGLGHHLELGVRRVS